MAEATRQAASIAAKLERLLTPNSRAALHAAGTLPASRAYHAHHLSRFGAEQLHALAAGGFGVYEEEEEEEASLRQRYASSSSQGGD